MKPLKIRVTFPDNKVICYAIVEKTFVESLKLIGTGNFHKLNLEVGHLPLISKEKYEKYGEWMKPIADGWYVNTQSDTSQKYMQLLAIVKQLHLDIKVEIGRDFETQSSKTGITRTRSKETLRLILPGVIDITIQPFIVYMIILRQIGLDSIKNKNLSIQDYKLVTSTKQYERQVQFEEYKWVTLPPKESLTIKWLSIVANVMNFKLSLVDIPTGKRYDFPNQISSRSEQTTKKPVHRSFSFTNHVFRGPRKQPTQKVNPIVIEELTAEQLRDNAKRIRRQMRYGGIHVGDMIISREFGKGKILSLDNFSIRADFDGVEKQLRIGVDYIDI